MDNREEEAREETTICVAKIPSCSSAEDLASHLPSHEPYRTWCPECVAGRGFSSQQSIKVKDDSAVPVVGLDYGYLASRGNPTRLVRPFYAEKTVITSGSSLWRCRTRVLKIIGAVVRVHWCGRTLDLHVVVLRSDKEQAIIALRKGNG